MIAMLRRTKKSPVLPVTGAGHSYPSVVVLLAISICLSGCGVLKRRDSPPDDPLISAAQRPIPPAKAQEVVSEVGSNWFYGPGLGQAALNVGAMVVFPPYAIYVLGNGLLSYAGYEPLYVTNLLPKESRNNVNEIYDGVTSAPGRFTAAVAGTEFRSKEVANERLAGILQDDSKGGAVDPADKRGKGSLRTLR